MVVPLLLAAADSNWLMLTPGGGIGIRKFCPMRGGDSLSLCSSEDSLSLCSSEGLLAVPVGLDDDILLVDLLMERESKPSKFVMDEIKLEYERDRELDLLGCGELVLVG